MSAHPLDLFDPRVRAWFLDQVGEPTAVQAQAWPRIAAGRHVLATAPTGSGKTLTAFLWALDRLLSGRWPGGRVRVLYVSPLKALNADIERNLVRPLAELGERFAAAGRPAPPVRVVTRSGDTPPAVRRKMIQSPPEILITTPESLNILLTSKGGRSILDSIETVILDEIHAVAGSKRGTHLITAVERLTLLAGEFQRVALSATVRPLERIARFVGGYEVARDDGGARYTPRPVECVAVPSTKVYDVEVRLPEEPLGDADEAVTDEEPRPGDGFWERLAPELKRSIRDHRSTLLFANSRRMTERITRLLNENEPDALAYSHHGSLSKEVRSVVERRLKAGELPALVATSSLELGIDVGDLDQVILLQTPKTVASAVQRIGRSGHRVGATSRGSIYPTHGRDLLEAAVVARAVLDGEIEETRPIEAPLDVLAQVVLSMVVADEWQIDDLYDFVRGSDPYRHLPRRQFELVLDMLAGRFADSRLRSLKPRVAIDKLAGTVRARPGADRLIYLSGGTIPDRGYFALRVKETMARLGELDEEFVWERSLGDTFTLGAQSWRIVQITHNDVLVAPARSGSAMTPFWRADERDRSFFLSEKVARFLGWADEEAAKPAGEAGLAERLRERYPLDAEVADEIVSVLVEQRAATGVLPHRRRLVAERLRDPTGPRGRSSLILHTLWGGKLNRPWAIALEAAWEDRYPDEPIEVVASNDAVLLVLPREVEVDEVLRLVAPERLEQLLRRRLEATGFFGARFRENAGRALLLPRAGFRHRTPLWLSRQRSKKLLESVAESGDFPIVVETWRTCLRDAFELEPLKRLLGEAIDGDLAVAEVVCASPSPFAAALIWKQTNAFMYDDDTPLAGARAGSLSDELLRELVTSGSLRPRLPAALVDELERKLQRLHPGYAPSGAGEIVEWVKERRLLPVSEWRRLVEAIERDAEAAPSGDPPAVDLGALGERLVRFDLPGAAEPATVAIEALPALAAALALAPEAPAFEGLALGGLDGAPLTAGARAAVARSFEIAARAPARPADASSEDGGLDDEGSDDEGLDDAGPPDDDRRSELLAALVADWARFYGPFDPARLGEVFGLEAALAGPLIDGLADEEIWVVDSLTVGAEGAEICDRENLEILLRWGRAARRPSFEALPIRRLPLFLADHQGLVTPGEGLDDLEERLEQLLLLPAPAASWEREILPARLDPYYPSWLDSLFQESDLLWLGAGEGKVLFTFPGDLDLVTGSAPAEESETTEETEEEAPARSAESAAGGRAAGRAPRPRPGPPAVGDAARLLPAVGRREELADVVARCGGSAAEVTSALWRLAWEGRVTNDTVAALRQGLLSRFEPDDRPARRVAGSRRPRPGRRRRFDRWQARRPHPGRWMRIDWPPPATDALEEDERARERARILLGRYGILFRELLARELPELSWRAVFRSLRLLELAGEVLSGYFFEGISGPQFMIPAAFRQLSAGLPEDRIWWLNATDPASPCGLDLADLKGSLPRRHPTTHLVYQGDRCVVVSTRGGRDLTIEVDAGHPQLPEYLRFLKIRLTREFDPEKSLTIETINGEPAAKSPYVDVLARELGVSREGTSVKVWRRYE